MMPLARAMYKLDPTSQVLNVLLHQLEHCHSLLLPLMPFLHSANSQNRETNINVSATAPTAAAAPAAAPSSAMMDTSRTRNATMVFSLVTSVATARQYSASTRSCHEAGRMFLCRLRKVLLPLALEVAVYDVAGVEEEAVGVLLEEDWVAEMSTGPA